MRLFKEGAFLLSPPVQGLEVLEQEGENPKTVPELWTSGRPGCWGAAGHHREAGAGPGPPSCPHRVLTAGRSRAARSRPVSQVK